MNRWLLAALAVSFSVCVACDRSNDGSGEDMSVPDGLVFTPPKEGPDKAKTEQEIAEFKKITGAAGYLDLSKVIEQITRTVESDASKEQAYQQQWNQQSALTKDLAQKIGNQIASQDCILSKTPEKNWTPADFKTGQTLESRNEVSLSGARCAAKSRTNVDYDVSVKSISAPAGITEEYAAYYRVNMAAQAQVLDTAFPAARYSASYDVSGPLKYKLNQYYEMYFKGSWKIAWSNDGKPGLDMNCGLQFLVKAAKSDYLMDCAITNVETGSIIPYVMHLGSVSSGTAVFEIYVAGRKLDWSSLLPAPQTMAPKSLGVGIK